MSNKSKDKSFTCGQWAAIILGIPAIYIMHDSVNDIIKVFKSLTLLHAILLFVSIFAIPVIYMNGFGVVIAAIVDAIKRILRL